LGAWVRGAAPRARGPCKVGSPPLGDSGGCFIQYGLAGSSCPTYGEPGPPPAKPGPASPHRERVGRTGRAGRPHGIGRGAAVRCTIIERSARGLGAQHEQAGSTGREQPRPTEYRTTFMVTGLKVTTRKGYESVLPSTLLPRYGDRPTGRVRERDTGEPAPARAGRADRPRDPLGRAGRKDPKSVPDLFSGRSTF
jgi:hypothetical protein